MNKTILPADWQQVKLRDVLSKYKLGGNYDNTKKRTSCPLIKMGNVQRGYFDVKKIEYIAESAKVDLDDELKYGDLLFNTRNALDLVGKVAIWRTELPKAYYNSNLLKLSFKSNEVSSNFFMNYLLNARKAVRHLKRFATGTTSVAAIYTRDVLNLSFFLPPLDEQRKIVEVLESWDNYLNNLNDQIKCKNAIKRSLMRKLLDGDIRVSGFSKKWEVKPLSSYVELILRPISKPEKSFMALGIRSHCKGTFQKRDFDPRKIAMDILYEVLENDLVVNITFAWEGAIAIAKMEDKGGLVSHRFPTYVLKSGVGNVDYFRQFIQSKRFRHLLRLISPGGAGRNRVLSKKDFLKLKIRVSDYNEQVAIAQILTAADQEIEALKKKKLLIEQQKKILLNNLITGKIRFPEFTKSSN